MRHIQKGGLHGDAERLQKVLEDSRSSAAVVRSCLHLLGKMGLLPDAASLDRIVRANLRLTGEWSAGNSSRSEEPKPRLAAAAELMILDRLERARFNLDYEQTKRMPKTSKIEDGTGVARSLLDISTRPDERIARLVKYPLVARAQLAIGDNLHIMSAPRALECVRPQFVPALPGPESDNINYTVRNFATNGPRITIVRSEHEITRHVRKVRLAADGTPPELFGQRVILTDRQYTAVSAERAKSLPDALFKAAGGLTLQNPLEELETLLALQDPEVAIPATSAMWLRQEISARPIAEV